MINKVIVGTVQNYIQSFKKYNKNTMTR